MPLSEIVRQAKTTTKGMSHGDKKVERRGDIVRKPNKKIAQNHAIFGGEFVALRQNKEICKEFCKKCGKKSVFAIA